MTRERKEGDDKGIQRKAGDTREDKVDKEK